MADLFDKKEQITLLQRMLSMLGAAWGDPAMEVPVCGAWNERTEEALRRFQQRERLPVTGICDRESWDAMAACCAEEEEARAPVYIAVRETKAARGDEGDAVAQLQLVLRGLAGAYPIPPVPLDGCFGAETEEALKAFQRIAGLPRTGCADRKTWRALAEAYDCPEGDC